MKLNKSCYESFGRFTSKRAFLGKSFACTSHDRMRCLPLPTANAEQITHQLAIIAFFLLFSLSLLGCL